MNIRFYQFLLSLLLILSLNGCGFQLRGYNSNALPFHSLYLESNPPYTHFSQQLREALKTMGIHICSSPTSLKLQILEQNFSRTLTSLGSAGQTTTYLLTFTILFQLKDNMNHCLLPIQQIRTTRNFSITSNQLNGDLNTESNLEIDMQRDAVQQLITRLDSPLLRKQHQPYWAPR